METDGQVLVAAPSLWHNLAHFQNLFAHSLRMDRKVLNFTCNWNIMACRNGKDTVSLQFIKYEVLCGQDPNKS
jgi:hypothetical protein